MDKLGFLLTALFGFVLGWAARSEDMGSLRPRWLKRRQKPTDTDRPNSN
jgi:hypothetical protein